MSEREKEILGKMAEVFPALSEEKQERWLGYAEGVADAMRMQETRKEEKRNAEDEA